MVVEVYIADFWLGPLARRASYLARQTVDFRKQIPVCTKPDTHKLMGGARDDITDNKPLDLKIVGIPPHSGCYSSCHRRERVCLEKANPHS